MQYPHTQETHIPPTTHMQYPHTHAYLTYFPHPHMQYPHTQQTHDTSHNPHEIPTHPAYSHTSHTPTCYTPHTSHTPHDIPTYPGYSHTSHNPHAIPTYPAYSHTSHTPHSIPTHTHTSVPCTFPTNNQLDPDIDNNGFLDKNDFECLAVKNTLIEGRGEFKEDAYANNKKIMSNLWNEIAELADFNKDGEVTVDEFKQAVKNLCCGKTFDAFPTCFKTFISKLFCAIDVNGDGLVGVDEYRLDCITRSAFANVKEIDDAYNKLCTDGDKKAGGISLSRYQELYAQFISNPDENSNAVFLFGPLKVVQ
ncbi:hypothetical protein Pcinc_037888 [Petrolisthes cinctipes]|uniref:EF-hand domain-containing protein n=1 Tax=Petrolisthes cinctipes TaxID=88211 RepID=A0AAE1BV38_PETCI|nr:hypothetical protein Pcinc_037888 [Petrolisthes cinctipes]